MKNASFPPKREKIAADVWKLNQMFQARQRGNKHAEQLTL